MKHRQLLQLLRDNAAPRAEGGAPPAIRAETTEDGSVTIYVYSVITPWAYDGYGASAADLSQALAAARGKDILLRVNSPGGDVFEGRAMAALLVSHDGRVVTQIDGLIASAATYLARAANEVRMTDGGRYMIHNSWTLGYGDKGDLRKTADLLDGIDADIASDYVRSTGATLDQVTAWMDAETWFSAQEALDNKFVDAITPNTKRGDDTDKDSAAANAARWNLSAYANAPRFEQLVPAAKDPLTPFAQAARASTAARQDQANRNRVRLLNLATAA